MSVEDPLPDLVSAFVQQPGGPADAPLLGQVQRHVARVSRPYPDAYFALARKDAESAEDLGNRVFTVCSRVPKGRYPFSGREPFTAFHQERFDGRTIRYHGFYAKLSITREILRDDYARNITRDPVLRWRARLYEQVGAALADVAVSERRGRGAPLTWSLPDAGPGLLRSAEIVVERLRERLPADIADLVRLALEQGGPATQSRLTQLIEAVLPAPAPAHEPAVATTDDLPTTIAVRRAVVAAWSELDADERDLLSAVARGESYDTLVERHTRFRHKVAITRAVGRIGRRFVDRVCAELGVDAHDAAPPQALAEAILSVLEACISDEGAP